MNILHTLIKNSIKNLTEFYKITSEIDHNGEKGGFREYFLSQLLRPLLPEHFKIGSGIITDHDGKQSSQTDIIIYDERLMPPIWKIESRGIYPIESVLAVIEVKSKFTATDCEQVIKAAKKIGPKYQNENLKEEGMHIITQGTTENRAVEYPLFTVFAYESDAPEKNEFERLKEYDCEALEYVKMICILNKGIWVVRDHEEESRPDDKTQNAIDFIVLLVDVLERIASQRGKINLKGWLGLSDSLIKKS